jgi:hypothetical protein
MRERRKEQNNRRVKGKGEEYRKGKMIYANVMGIQVCV